MKLTPWYKLWYYKALIKLGLRAPDPITFRSNLGWKKDRRKHYEIQAGEGYYEHKLDPEWKPSPPKDIIGLYD